MRPLALAPLLLVGCVLPANGHVDRDALTFAEPVHHVRIDVAAGDVTVETADVPEITVERRLEWTGDRPDVVARVADGVLVLKVTCSRDPFGGCAADHTVTLPTGGEVIEFSGAGDDTGLAPRSVDVFTGAGDVTLLGIDGAVDVETGAGDVTLDGITGDVHASTGAGGIDGAALVSEVLWAWTGAGDVSLKLDVVPAQADASTGAGDITFKLPHAAIDLATHTGAGDITVSGVDVDKGAAAQVDLETGAGDIVVRGL